MRYLSEQSLVLSFQVWSFNDLDQSLIVFSQWENFYFHSLLADKNTDQIVSFHIAFWFVLDCLGLCFLCKNLQKRSLHSCKFYEKQIYFFRKRNIFLFFKNDLFSEWQQFVLSETTELLYKHNKYEIDIAVGKHVISVYIDVSKAFDSCDHEILIKKIGRTGLDEKGIRLMSNYLKDRKNLVIVNGKEGGYFFN